MVSPATGPGDGFLYLVSSTVFTERLRGINLNVTEGTLTCVVGIAMWWLIADFPETAKWLNEEEKAFVKARLEEDVGDSGLTRKPTLKDVRRVFKDCKS